LICRQWQISVTPETYSHVLPSMQREAAEKAERLVLGGDVFATS